MNENVLIKYFKSQIDNNSLLDNLFVDSVDLENNYQLTKVDLIKLCDLVLNGKLDFSSLQKIAFHLICSEQIEWDSNKKDGEIISTTIFDWNNPEINYPLTIENIELWKFYLETGRYRLTNRLFYVELLKGDGHNDLLIESTKMNLKSQFDSYYFQLAKEPFENQDIKNGISELLEYWKTKIVSMTSDNSIYLPIDFSDEYTGCFKFTIKNNDKIQMEYGFSRIEGFSLSPIDPGDYYKSVIDFTKDNDYSEIEVSRKELIDAINKNIKELRKNVG